MLGISRTAVRNLDGIYLTPLKKKGMRSRVYARSEVEEAVLVRSGQSAKIAFELFYQGGRPSQLVREQGMPYKLAETLWLAYQRMREREECGCFLELAPYASKAEWRSAFGFERLDGEVVRAVLEAAMSNESVRLQIWRRFGWFPELTGPG